MKNLSTANRNESLLDLNTWWVQNDGNNLQHHRRLLKMKWNSELSRVLWLLNLSKHS